LAGLKRITLEVIGTDYIGWCKSNYYLSWSSWCLHSPSPIHICSYIYI